VGPKFSRILARPARGLSIRQTRARLQAIWPAMAAVSVDSHTPRKGREAMLASTLDLSSGGAGWTPLRSQYSKPLTVLIAISALVLLLTCINVANLLLARSAARRREFAIRLAIGAGRMRIVRQLLVESLLLSFLGAALGLFLAHYGSRLLLTRVSQAIHLDVDLNLAVLEFALAAAVLTGLLFGTAPALCSTSACVATTLHTSPSAGQARGRLWPMNAFSKGRQNRCGADCRVLVLTQCDHWVDPAGAHIASVGLSRNVLGADVTRSLMNRILRFLRGPLVSPDLRPHGGSAGRRESEADAMP
jgi:hypothetical protein